MKTKIKTPKAKNKNYFSATELNKFIFAKHRKSGKNFWKSFFSETIWGETGVLCFEPDGFEYPEAEQKYIDLLAKYFKKHADEELTIEIENDL